MRFITSDRVTLVYSDHGQGPAVVLLAGFGLAKEIWRAQIPVLVAAGYRVINLDSRGQGQSQRTQTGQSLKRRARDAHELMTFLGLQRPVLVGHSLGAATWFAFIAEFGDQEVRAIVDVDQPPRLLPAPGWSTGLKPLVWSKLPRYWQRPLGYAAFKAIDDDTAALIDATEIVAPFSSLSLLPLLIDHLDHDWRQVVRQLQVPLLIIAGAESPLFKPEFAAITAQMTAAGTSVVIPQAGHLVMAEQATEFNRILLTFLTNLL
ncbi:alpha/beta hydrolase [Lactiplantibacillus sp. WILCCON 0030]|uniref:Alpha/beta hydrolase n=1 Tax=Lactiplantibacillus brownii TaxID=3069269 RepID=A0ABU1A6Z2_9LACO|nr:alpha/beta hydrolase [Lactiplantibacillus brownii]MDQ7936110.1 alpha/beta hydrolase [Lactiplantibacillus brownii]